MKTLYSRGLLLHIIINIFFFNFSIMKKDYFSIFRTTFRKAVPLFFLLFACCLLSSVLAQSIQLTPAPNPHPTRMAPTTFTVRITNLSVTEDIPAGILRLDAVASAGFTITPATQTINTVILKDSYIDLTFTVTGLCAAPQAGGRIDYTLYDISNTPATVVRIANTLPITLTEVDFVFMPPAETQADFASATKTYTRVWAITQTAPDAATPFVRVINDVTFANFAIIKVEVVQPAGGGTYTPLLDVTGKSVYTTNKYTLTLDADIFSLVGNNDDLFNTGETVYIRETFVIKTCPVTNSSYSAEYGNGTQWCKYKTFDLAVTSVVPLVYTMASTIVTGSNKEPATCTANGGKGEFIVRYQNTSPDALNRAVARNLNLYITFTGAKYILSDAYFVNSSGVDLGLPHLISAPTRTNQTINFNNFDYVTYNYSVLNLIDFDLDGKVNDLPQTKDFYIKYEYEVDFSAFNNDDCFTTPNVFRDWFTTNMRYQNNCNTDLTGGTNTSTLTHGSTTLGYGPPQNQLVSPPNLGPGAKVTVTFFQNNNTNATTGGGNAGWSQTQSNDHWIVITLPKGFDYDNTISGLKISGAAITGATPYISPSKITKTFVQDDDPVPGAGFTVLTVYYDLATLGNALYYSIDMTALPWIPIPDKYKFMTLEHQWAYPDNPLCPDVYSYACVNFELNYEVRMGSGCLDFNADVRRMTFGWNKLDKSVKITPENAKSFGVDRDIAGPYDNIEVFGVLSTSCPLDNHFDKSDAIMEFEYRTMIPGLPTLFFPDEDYAVELIWKRNKILPHPGGLDRFELTKAQCIEKDEIVGYVPVPVLPTDPPADNGIHFIRVNIGNWALNTTNAQSPAIRDGDTLLVNVKLRTNENMPVTLSPVFLMRTRNYLKQKAPPYAISAVVSVLKNFRMVDYARKSFVRDNFAYPENTTGNIALAYASVANPSTLVLNGSEYWVNEYRPNQYAENFVCNIEGVWNLSRIGTRERIIGEGVASNLRTIRPLDPDNFSLTYPSGNTRLEISGRLETEYIDNFFFAWDCDVTSNCPSTTDRVTMTADYTYYPTSEEPKFQAMSRGPVNFITSFSKYTYTLSSAAPTKYPNNNDLDWDFVLTNTSAWSTSDRVLPNCWLSIEFPLGRIIPTTLVLTDNLGNEWKNFVYYGQTATTEKYWVKLDNLTLTATTRNFNIKCVYTNCTPFNPVLTFSMAKGGYPANPDIWFTGAGAPCPNKTTLTLNAIPELSSLRGSVISPPWNGPTGYLFCQELTYQAIFYNSQLSLLTNPVLEIILGQGLELIGATAMQDGSNVAIIDIIDSGPASERTVRIILDPDIIVHGVNTPGDQLFVDFILKPVCNFVNGYVPYVTFLSTNTCGERIGETKHTDPIYIDGITFVSDYLIPNFTVQPLSNNVPSANIDLSSATAAANCSVRFEADIQLNSSLQSTGDYIAISIPPNMTINSVSGQTFTYWKTESGNNFYKTPVATMLPNEIEKVELILTPTNPELWSCAPVTFKVFTGVFIPLTCDGKECGIEATHENDEVKTVNVTKNAVSFQPGASATGSYNSNTTEKVTFNGILNLPANTHFDNIRIEVFSYNTNDLIPGAFFDLNNITTDAVTTTLAFTNAIPLIIPTTEICDLYLVIRKMPTYNQYICDNVSIRIPPPSYSFTGTYSACVGEDLVVGNNPITGYTYTWSPNTYIVGSSTTTPITVNFPSSEVGTYTFSVEVARIGGCPVTARVDVEVVRLPDVFFDGLDEICVGETTQLGHDSGVGGTWTSKNTAVATVNATTGVVTAVGAGTATFEFTDVGTGCKNTTGELTVNALPTTPIITPSATTINCSVTSSTISVTNHTAGNTYIWYNNGTEIAGQTGSSLTVSASDIASTSAIFTVKAVHPTTGCISTLSSGVTINKAVTPPTVSATPSPVCTTGAITLSPTTGGTWASGNTAVATVSGSTVTIVGAGSVTFTFTETGTGCTATATVVVNAQPAIPTITPTATIINCTTTSSTINVTNHTAGLEYEWYKDDTLISGQTGSSLTVTATDISGTSATFTVKAVNTATTCISPLSSGVTINKNITPPTVSASPTDVCVDGAITLSPTTNGSWVSNNTAVATVSGSTVTITGTGSVTFTFTSSINGCPATTSAVTVNPLPIVSTPKDDICVGEQVTLSQDGSGTWTSSNSPVASVVATTGVVTGVAQGSASFTFTNTSTQCTASTPSINVHPIVTPTFDIPSQITYCFDETPVDLPVTSTNVPTIPGTWTPAVIDMTPGNTTTYTFNPAPGECSHPISITVTVKDRVKATDILVSDEEECLSDPVVFRAKSTKAADLIFRWYASPTATTPIYTGPNYPAGGFMSDTSFYVGAYNNNLCENVGTDRKKVNLHVIVCKLLGCEETLPNKYGEEDYYLANKHTHIGTDWDVPIVWHGTLDSIVYYVNGERLANPTLDGFEFPLCWSFVEVKAYYLTIQDECQFAVYIDRACPTLTNDDEGNEYKVTKLAGLCWTENLKATKYAGNLGEGDIEFAKPYYSALHPDTQYHFDTFGLLYDWYSAVGETAGNPIVQGICPEGWHIPSPAEWGLLDAFPAKDLKSENFWFTPGLDKYGFDARPAGWFNGAANRFEDLYGYTNWWSTVGTANGNGATSFSFNYFCDLLLKDTKSKGDALSVRCVLDEYDCE